MYLDEVGYVDFIVFVFKCDFYYELEIGGYESLCCFLIIVVLKLIGEFVFFFSG